MQYRWALWKINAAGNQVRQVPDLISNIQQILICQGTPLKLSIFFLHLVSARSYTDKHLQVVIAEVGDKDSEYSEFLERLPASDCRYGGDIRSAEL